MGRERVGGVIGDGGEIRAGDVESRDGSSVLSLSLERLILYNNLPSM